MLTTLMLVGFLSFPFGDFVRIEAQPPPQVYEQRFYVIPKGEFIFTPMPRVFIEASSKYQVTPTNLPAIHVTAYLAPHFLRLCMG